MSRPAAKKKIAEVFNCKFLNSDVNVVNCVDGYVNANSLNVKHSPCFKCSIGLKVRMQFAAQ
ncbi:MAG: hypothetical protein IV100_23255 [Myxococcales bacterium]|jgi:hypothetical protein|nr:hypothetical protein [Myxococcales bacterium]